MIPAAPTSSPHSRAEVLPHETLDLTRAQAGIWYAQQLDPDNPVYTISQYFDVRGPVDADAFRRAWEQVISEVDVLRARFAETEDGPVQVVSSEVRLHFARVDLSDEADPEAAAHEWIRTESAQALDPTRGPLVSVAVLVLGRERTFCYQRTHHIVLDGAGAAMVVPRLLAILEADRRSADPGPSPFRPLRELVDDDTRYAASDAASADAAHWAERLADLPDPTTLAARPTRMPTRLVRRRTVVPADVVAGLRESGSTSSLLIAAVAAYAARATGESDVVLSLPVTGRRGRVARQVPAMTSNIVPLRLQVRPGTALGDLAEEVSSEVRRAVSHQRSRPEDIRAALGLDAGARLSGTSVNILPPQRDTDLGGAPATLHNLAVGPVDDLSVIVSDPDDGTLQIDLDGNPDLYDDDVLGEHLDRLVLLLTDVAGRGGDADLAVGSLDVTTVADRATVTDFGRGAGSPPLRATIHDLFSAQVRRTPGATALVSGSFRLSFADLDWLTNRAARELITHDVGPGRTVAVALPRTADLVISMIAIAKSGGAYLPIDPSYPDDRIAHMITDARPNCVITDSEIAERLPVGTPTLVVDDAEQLRRLDERDDSEIAPHRAGPADPAYVIYTSGSTGRPKGVVVEHASLSNLFAHHHADVFAPAVAAVGGRRLRVAHISAVSFDASWDPILWMLDGHELHFITERVRRDPEALVAHLGEIGADSVETTPSYVAQLLDAGLLEAGVCVICLGGEAVGDALWRRLLEIPDILAFNFFGPAESTVDTVVARIARFERPVIGRPVGNTRAYVLDSGLAPMGVGATGELYLAGAGLARGYLGRPEQTAERFVPDPYGPPGERMYRTGDLARWRADGVLEFAGRTDDQIKVRGFRVELGEIDAVLAEHPSVSAAATLIRGQDGAGHLVSHVVPDGDAGIDPDVLRGHAAAALPEHMVPSVYVPLGALPLTPNGKLDQRALPSPEQDGLVAGRTSARSPATPAEELLSGLFAQALGVAQVGVEDDFFALGGHSLLATRLISRIRATFDVDMPIRTLFETPTVAGLAAGLDDADRGRPVLGPRERPEPLPLSAAQRRLWFLDQLDPDSAAYHLPLVLRLTGDLDVDALRGALDHVVVRHETLRTLLPAPRGEPRQQVLDPVDPAVARAAALPVRSVAAADVDDTARTIATRPFALDREPPLRAELLEVTEREHVLVLVLHHVAADGWSLRPLARDLAEGYRARRAGRQPRSTPLPVQYADYALWQHDLLGDEDDPASEAARQLDHWIRRLDGSPEELALPTDRPRPARAGSSGGSVPVTLPADVHAGLAAVARESGASVFMVLQAAWAATLSRLGAGSDVPIGSPIAGRTDEALDELVGFFVNTVVLRTDVSGDPSFAELVARVREGDLEAYAHQDVPFERVVEAVAPSRSLARHPLFQVMLAYRNTDTADLGLPGLDVTVDAASEAVGAKFDLNLDLGEGTDTDGATIVDGTLDYDAELFDEDTVRDIAVRFERLVAAAVADPARPVGALEVLGDEEVATLRRLADGGAPAPYVSLPARLARQVETVPDALALVDGTTSWTFSELGARVDALAGALAPHAGATVAVALPRSGTSIIALLAVLRAGAVYVPVDVEQPADRRARILTDAAPAAAVVDPHDPVEVPDGVEVLVPSATGHVPGDDPAPRDAAYVLFTSGSTGRPKGVVVEHGSLAALVAHHETAMIGTTAERLGRAVRTAHTTAVSFDASWDPVAWLVCGHTLRLVDDETRRDPEALVALVDAEGIDTLETTPSHAAALVEAGLLDTGLSLLALGGEAVSTALWDRLREAEGLRALNLYGPTEATVDAVTADLAHHERPVIGRPVAGVRALVLDDRLAPAPIGAPGELYLAGAGVARAYLGRPDLTAERFVAEPAGAPGQRMYRTGDRARWTRAGVLEFAGRVDDQVKVRGFRVELGEIEAALVDHPDVARAAPLVVGERLVAYLVPTPGAADLDIAAVHAHAATRLPDYMVPASLTRIDELPLTVHGKLDRTALPEPAADRGTGRAPATGTEAALCRVFAAVLGLEQVGPDDDFFALGGHSLVATRLVGRIRSELDVDLPLRALFEVPTVAGLAERVEGADAGGPRIGTLERPEALPASSAQQRLWFLAQLEDTGAAYHLPAAVTLRSAGGELDVTALRAALHDVVARHEALRTVLRAIDGAAQQVILPADEAAPRLAVLDVDPDAVPAEATRIAEAPFDLAVDPPLRAGLLRVTEREHVLVLVLHHVAADGWSMGPLARDLAAAYTARRDGRAPDLAPLAVQYADYTLWQDARLGSADDPDSPTARQLAYWRDRLADLPAELDLPTDRPRPREASYRGDEVGVDLGPDRHARIAAVARESGASVFMVLQAAWAATLSRLGAGSDVPIGSPIAGRTDEALDELVGFFVNTVVLRTDVSGDPSFAELVARVREGDLEAYAHQDVPFERVVEAVAPSRSLARHPLFQVMLTLDVADAPTLDLPGVDAAVEPITVAGAKFDLSISLTEQPDAGGLAGTVEYATDLFDRDTVEALVTRFTRLLDTVLADPDAPLHAADLLVAGERDTLGRLGDGGPVPAGPATIVERFVAQVAATPDAVALVDDRCTLTFAELAGRSHRLARLLTGRGTGRGDTVAVALPRGADSIVALLGVLAAGAVYVPIDLEHPDARIATILAGAAPSTVLTTAEAAGRLPAELHRTVLDDPGNAEAWAAGSVGRLAPPDPGDAAYVLFTSGSTGRPKGVVVEHGSLAALVAGHERDWFAPAAQRLGRAVRTAHTTAVSFDASWDPVAWLVCGHTLRLVDDGTRRDPEALVALVRDEGIDGLETTPTHAAALLDAGLLDAGISILALGGEAVPPALWDRLRGVGGLEVRNLYGPTEATVDAVTADLADHERPVVGRPVPGTRAQVLDAHLTPVPVGARGELYLAGAGVARAYLGRPDLTAERFVADPFGGPGERMYRTGDRARWTRAGVLEFAGRVDDQVKVRGFRVELGEVEAALVDHPDIARAAPLVVGEEPGARLVAYLVPTDGADPDVRDVRVHAAARLADYMVPTAFALLDELPRTVNGKLDRAALPEPAGIAAGHGARARTPDEQRLAGLFAAVLGTSDDGVGVDDNFFDLGGHSMSATRLVEGIRAEFDVDVPVRALFEAPTVAGLAERLGADRPGSSGLTPLLSLRTGGARPPLFAIHPMSGVAWPFAGLLGVLPDDQPVYGLQARGIADPDDLPRDAEDLVDGYVRSIRSVAAHGPYRLLGWSLGGEIAHRVTSRLQAEGETVERLIMLDSRPGAAGELATGGTDEDALLAAYLTAQGVPVDDAPRPLDPAAARRLLEAEGHPLAALDDDAVGRAVTASVHHARLLAGLDFEVVDGDIEYLTATRTASPDDPAPPRWAPLVTGDVREHPCDVAHGQMLAPDGVALVGPVVDAVLARPTGT